MSARTAEKLYDEDFYAWTQLQARELQRFARTRPNLPLDLPHLAEEIRDVGKHERNTLRSLTARVLEHLLLLAHSPSDEPRRGWKREVRAFRREIDRRITGALRRDLERQLPRLYAEARKDLSDDLADHGETDVVARLPAACPWKLDEVLGDYWPDET